MSRLSFVALIMVITTAIVSPVSAATTTGSTTATGSTGTASVVSTTPVTVPQPKNLPLLLDTVKVENTQTLTLKFNQSVYANSIRVRVIDQGSNENIQIASITGTLDKSGALDKSSVTITTDSSFIAGASYILTITAALSLSDTTIKAGIDSIREFAAPTNLKPPVLNAAPNPTATLATGSTTTTVKPIPTTTTLSGSTGSTSSSGALAAASEFPEAGLPTTMVVILAAMSAMVLLFIRKRA